MSDVLIKSLEYCEARRLPVSIDHVLWAQKMERELERKDKRIAELEFITKEQLSRLTALTEGITEATGKEGSTAILLHIGRLEAENYQLATGACVVEGALQGDERGNLCCKLAVIAETTAAGRDAEDIAEAIRSHIKGGDK